MPKRDEPTLADKAQRIAEGTPRDAIQALIKRFMPDVPVRTRPSVPTPMPSVAERSDIAAQRQPNNFAKLARAKSRRVVARDQRYEWIGFDTSRVGTFRRYMLSEIIKPHTSTAEARSAHIRSGRFADQTINFTWAEKEGYIRWIKE